MSSNGTTPARAARALLIFAHAPALDLVRRRWPQSFRPLLGLSCLKQGVLDGVDLHLFTTHAGSARESLQVHLQQGKSFGERLHHAVQTLVRQGYSQIVVVGSDCPELTLEDIRLAFQGLTRHRLVVGPDHRGGVYLLGLHAGDQGLLQGIPWQQNRDFQALLNRFAGLPALTLPPKHDLDSLRDLRLLCRVSRGWEAALERFLRQLDCQPFRAQPPRASLPRLAEKISWQLPPPRPLP